jgi:hypothetical protein
MLAGQARKAGQVEREAALVEALKIIGGLRAALAAQEGGNG